jgi:hypothetical protein
MFYNIFKQWVAIQLRLVNPMLAYGEKLFNALARLTLSTSLEAGCVRRNPETGMIQVAIAMRSSSESFWPNQGHLPGTIYRPYEKPGDTLARLIKKEFGKLSFRSCIFVGVIRPANEQEMKDRGHTNSELWMILGAVEFDPKVFWVNAENPQSMAEFNLHYRHSRDLMPALVAALRRYESGGETAVPRVEEIVL